MGGNKTDAFWMRRALELARRGKGRTSPNPAVGAVIVKDGEVIGEGWHKKAGKPHAEIEALRACSSSPKDATLYVTLEPCNHHGRTPPCVEAIIKAGVARVVMGARDASPKEGIKGAVRLKRAGIKTRVGVLREECERMIEDFTKHSTTGLPFVLLKTAMTLDGKIAAQSGDSKWISSEDSRKMTHRLRSEADAVMVGADTVIVDDPQLTVRSVRGKNPLRVIVDGKLRIPLDSKIVKSAKSVPTLVAASSSAPLNKARALARAGVEVFVAPSRGKRVDLPKLMEELGMRGVMSVLLEGAGELAGAAIEAEVVDRVMFFIAPKLVGGSRCAMTGFAAPSMADAVNLEDMAVSRMGPDVIIEGRIVK